MPSFIVACPSPVCPSLLVNIIFKALHGVKRSLRHSTGRARARGTLCLFLECCELPVTWIKLASVLTLCHGSGSITPDPGTSETQRQWQLADGRHKQRFIGHCLAMNGTTTPVIADREEPAEEGSSGQRQQARRNRPTPLHHRWQTGASVRQQNSKRLLKIGTGAAREYRSHEGNSAMPRGAMAGSVRCCPASWSER